MPRGSLDLSGGYGDDSCRRSHLPISLQPRRSSCRAVHPLGGPSWKALHLISNPPRRRYERGENRRKHLGSAGQPEIVETAQGELVGKCPANFPIGRRQVLLDQAIPHITTAPYTKAFPKRLYTVDQDGTIYTAQTSSPGDSYHGYPYAGRMGNRLINALRTIARQQGCEAAFDKWLRRHIKVGGPPDL